MNDPTDEDNDGSEIRLPDPTVEELRLIFFEEHGGTL
jgi:hypothetical protein